MSDQQKHVAELREPIALDLYNGAKVAPGIHRARVKVRHTRKGLKIKLKVK